MKNKILLFTHKSDIDGMGNVVLAKLAFYNVDYVLCETFNLQDEMAKYYNNGTIYQYDKIFVTDLWLEEPMLSKVATDEKLNGKFLVFDHHESAIIEGFNKYDFTTIKVSNAYGLCSGTSLFYEYLIKQGYLNHNDALIKDFVELTRKYDTWEWATKYHEEMPHELTLLFDSIGREGYIKLMFEKLNEHEYTSFQFNKLEKMLITNKIKQTKEILANYASKVYYRNIFGLKAGIVFTNFEYRNDLAEYFRQHNFDMDFAMLISLDYGVVSYRSIKKGVSVRQIAEKLGGKGHENTASSPIREEQKDELIRVLTKEKNKGI